MRYIDLYEERAIINDRSVTLIKNPPPSMVEFYLEGYRRGIARGLVINGDIFIFDAFLAAHADVEEYFNLPVSENGFDLAERDDGTIAFTAPERAMPELVRNPHLRRILQDPRVMIARQSGEYQTLEQFEGHALTEGLDINATVQSALDKTLSVVNRKHVTYAQAIEAYDRYVELVGEEPIFPKREDLSVHPKDGLYAWGMMISMWRILHATTSMGQISLGAAVAAIGAAVFSAHNRAVNQFKRRDMLKSTAREERWAAEEYTDAEKRSRGLA